MSFFTGLARKEDFPYITYYCPHCHALNRSKHMEEHNPGSNSPSTGSLTAVVDPNASNNSSSSVSGSGSPTGGGVVATTLLPEKTEASGILPSNVPVSWWQLFWIHGWSALFSFLCCLFSFPLPFLGLSFFVDTTVVISDSGLSASCDCITRIYWGWNFSMLYVYIEHMEDSRIEVDILMLFAGCPAFLIREF